MANKPVLIVFGFRTIFLLCFYGLTSTSVSSANITFSVGSLIYEDWNEDETSVVNTEIWKYIRNDTALLYTTTFGYDLDLFCSGAEPIRWTISEERV
jgi:hypothetical protein